MGKCLIRTSRWRSSTPSTVWRTVYFTNGDISGRPSLSPPTALRTTGCPTRISEVNGWTFIGAQIGGKVKKKRSTFRSSRHMHI